MSDTPANATFGQPPAGSATTVSRIWITHVTIGVCLSLTATVMVLRIWSRYFIIHRMGVDDWLAIASLILIVGQCICLIDMGKHGLGHHVSTLSNEDQMEYQKRFFASIILYVSTLMVLKLTLLFQYYRVLAVQHMRKWYISAILLIGAWGLSQVIVSLCWCVPLKGFWDHTVKARCIPPYPQIWIFSAGNIFTDFIVILLPMPVLFKLNVPKTQKILLFFIFSLGFLTVAISCIRLRFVAHSIDPTWTNIEGSSWSLAELSCALICACLPTLKPVLSRCIPALSFRVTSKHSNRRPGNIDPESPKNPLKVHGKTTIITVDDGTVPTFNTLTVNGSQEALVSRQHKQDRNMTTTFPEFKSLENPWNYIPQAGLDQAAEARLLKRQLDLGLAVTTQTEITHDPRNLAVPQDGTIRIEREVITYTR